MNCLDLFSGTHSFANCCKEIGYNCLTLDRDLPADINIDIMQWDYKSLDPNSFDIIWASPPCVAYSRLRYCNLGKTLKNGIVLTKEILENDMKESDKIVQRTLDIIKYFNPHWWFMENPQTARLKDRDVVKHLPFYDVDYCKYSDFGYKKRTRIWTNRQNFIPKLCNKDCENMIITETQKLHKERMGTSKTIIDNGKIIRVNKKHLREKYKDYPNIMAQHKKVLANGYEMIDGKKVLCNTKEKRDALRKHKASFSCSKDSGQLNIGGGTNRLERYRVPSELIFSLLLD